MAFLMAVAEMGLGASEMLRAPHEALDYLGSLMAPPCPQFATIARTMRQTRAFCLAAVCVIDRGSDSRCRGRLSLRVSLSLLNCRYAC